MALSSSSVGCRSVTTFRSSTVVTWMSRSWTRKDSAPVLRTSHATAVNGFFNIRSRRRFFFFCKIAFASSEKSGAMITSLKISAIASAHEPSSG